MDKIRVIIADDHELVRDGLRRIVEAEEDMDCVGVAENGLKATVLKSVSMEFLLLCLNKTRSCVLDTLKMFYG